MDRTGGYSRSVHRYNIAVDDFKNFGTLLLALHRHVTHLNLRQACSPQRALHRRNKPGTLVIICSCSLTWSAPSSSAANLSLLYAIFSASDSVFFWKSDANRCVTKMPTEMARFAAELEGALHIKQQESIIAQVDPPTVQPASW